MAIKRVVATLLGIACWLPSAAADGRGLELYYAQYESFAYLIAALAITGYLLGMRQGVNWWRSLLGAFAVLFFATLFEYVIWFGMPHYLQYRIDGDLNPDPLKRALLGSTSSSIMLGLVGAVLWWDLAKRYGRRPARRLAFHVECFGLYVLIVFGCLGIQLTRERPYAALESQVAADRKELLTLYVPIALQERRSYPVAKSFPEFIESLRPWPYDDDPGLWAAAYEPIYHKFDRGEMRRHRIIEWNPAFSGKPFGAGDEKRMWLYAPWIPKSGPK